MPPTSGMGIGIRQIVDAYDQFPQHSRCALLPADAARIAPQQEGDDNLGSKHKNQAPAPAYGKKPFAREEGLFVIEGVRELEAALQNGFPCIASSCVRTFFSIRKKADMLKKQAQHTEEITAAVYGKTAYRGTTEGVLAIMHQKDTALERMQIPEHPYFLCWNLWKNRATGGCFAYGRRCRCSRRTRLRSVNRCIQPQYHKGFSGSALYRSPPLPVPLNKHTIGCTKHNVQLVAATCQASTPYDRCDYKKPTAFVLGSEDKGLEEFWRPKKHIVK